MVICPIHRVALRQNCTSCKNFVDAVAKHMGASPQNSYSNRSLRFKRAGRRQKGGYLRAMDRIVLEIWQTWFASTSNGCEHGEFYDLVLASYSVPSSRLTIEQAAAIGWALSWIGVRAVAPAIMLPIASHGLATWASFLPLRSPSTKPSEWMRTVFKWLIEDLRKSYALWLQIATFMHQQQHYLLRGKLAEPKNFALKHTFLQ